MGIPHDLKPNSAGEARSNETAPGVLVVENEGFRDIQAEQTPTGLSNAQGVPVSYRNDTIKWEPKMNRQRSLLFLIGISMQPGYTVWPQELPRERQRVEDLKQQTRQLQEVDMQRRGKLASQYQNDPTLKAEYERLFKDTDRLLTATEEVKAELGKNDRSVLSMTSIKRSEEIEKLAKKSPLPPASMVLI
jgi:hypothetical protein